MTSVVHPAPFHDLESGIKGGKGISRKSSLNFKERQLRNEEGYELRSSSSCPSLSAELVESVMCDGQFRYVNEKAHEAAMWCGLISFLILGFGLVVIGLHMALSSI